LERNVTSSLLPTYARAEIAFERGEGAWLTSATGERFLDFGGGIAVASLGYSHPHLVAALIEQGQKLWHTSNLFEIPQAERLAGRLTAASFADYVFFTNSGAEAVEGTIKTARKFQAASGSPEKFHVMTFSGAFHGRTLATIAAGGNPKYIEGFGPKAAGFDLVPFGDLKAAKAAITPATGAILIEPIQGEGGVRIAEPEFLRGLRALCDEHGLLLIFDEVQTGIGRVGKLFAYELSGVVPDLMAIAKGIGGGFPLGAFLATREAAKGMTVGTHGSTFGGNPLATAVAREAIRVLQDEELALRSRILGKTLIEALRAIDHPAIIEVRGKGLWVGVELDPTRAKAMDVCLAMLRRGALTKDTHETVIRFAPPLVIEEADMLEAVSIFHDALEDVCPARALSFARRPATLHAPRETA
jgi:acetylornithine/N-succinyldiaminopimelate aminotransferase